MPGQRVASARTGGNVTEFRYADDVAQGVAAFWWVERGFGYAVAARGLERTALLRAAEAVHRQVLQNAAPALSL